MIPIVKYARPAREAPQVGSRRESGVRESGVRENGASPEPASHPAAVRSLRAHVLEVLAGPEYRPVHAIPHRWPVQRAHVRRVVRMLWEEGRLERRPGAGGDERWVYRVMRR